jgi:hypothetical protein
VSIIALLAASTDLRMEDLRAVRRALGGDYAAIADPGRKLPSIRDDVPHRQVLDRLKAARIVSDYKPFAER